MHKKSCFWKLFGSESVEAGLSPSKKWFCLFKWKPFKNNEKWFYFILKASFVLKYLNIRLDFLVMEKKRSQKFDVTNLLTNNRKTDIV